MLIRGTTGSGASIVVNLKNVFEFIEYEDNSGRTFIRFWNLRGSTTSMCGTIDNLWKTIKESNSDLIFLKEEK